MIKFNYLLAFYSYIPFTDEQVVEITLELKKMTFVESIGVYSWLLVFFILGLAAVLQIKKKKLKKNNKR